MNAAQELETIFNENEDKKICVVGTTCAGKSTLNKKFNQSIDMDQVVFSHLTPSEIATVDVDKWTPKVGEKMESLAKRHVSVSEGKPVFGTVVFDECDLVVYLDIDEKLLKERCNMRGVDFKNAKAMDNHLRKQVANSRIPAIAVRVDQNIESKTK